MSYHELTFEQARNMTTEEIKNEIHRQMYEVMPENADRQAWGAMIDQEVKDFITRFEAWEEDQE